MRMHDHECGTYQPARAAPHLQPEGGDGIPTGLPGWTEQSNSETPRRAHDASIELIAFVALAALVSGALGAGYFYHATNGGPTKVAGNAAMADVVERIIRVESNGDPNAKNKRSSATGAGQFLDITWLEMLRAHRADLARTRNQQDLLDLRRDPDLAREITARWVERNAAMLKNRGLPVTPGTLYLTYFAGPAGALALLSGAEELDAASLMASADASGRTTRDKIVKANPFLAAFTVGDLKRWADRKMRGL
jgi:hypothetical protein